MEDASALHSTFVIERRYPKAPEQVFAAFADPARKRRWYAESDTHEVERFELDFRVGGAERFSYRFKPGGPFAGVEISNEGRYLDILANRRIVLATAMAFAGKPISVALVTFELLRTDGGTDLICTHQGVFFEGADGPDMREQGWRALFGKLDHHLART
jgi:uncharacterized protein YndB with AHSA1/START domain